MAKVFLGVGHGGTDSGAAAYLIEKDINLVMALACRDYLQNNGVEVLMSRTIDENDPLEDEIKECNAYNPDLALDIHNNAGGGDGFEAYYHFAGGTGKTLALNLESEIIKIGQNSRGCKIKKNSSGKDYYGFIRLTSCPAVIVEGVFVDNAKDIEIANTKEKQKIFGYAYARGILRTLGITPKEINQGDVSTSSSNEVAKDSLYKVQIGAYKDKNNADEKLKQAKDKGFKDAYIKEE